MNAESLSGDTLLRVSQLTSKKGRHGILGIGRSSFYRLLEADKFPKPIRPMPGVVAWRASDVSAWIRGHMAG